MTEHQPIETWLTDMDGVLVHEEHAIPGATEFIEKRDEVQNAAESYIQTYLSRYEVETRGVYIQDVIFPADLGSVSASVCQTKRNGRG